MSKKFYTVGTIGLIFSMFVSLGILLFVQIDWIDYLYKNELWRLNTDISEKTMQATNLLEDELLLLANLSQTRERNIEDLEIVLGQLILFWEENTYNKDLMSAIYVINTQDFAAAREWNDGAFINTNIDNNESLRKNLLSINLPTYKSRGASYFSFVDNTDIILSSVSPLLPNYYLISVINNEVLSNIIIPYVISSYFYSDNIYSIRIVDTQMGETLYSNHKDLEKDTFLTPDFSWILFETSFGQENINFRQITPWPYPISDSDIPLDGLRSYYVDSQYVYEDIDTKEIRTKSAKNGQIIIEVVHKDGSLIKAARSATQVNFISSSSIIFLLIFGFLFLLRNLKKSLSLARKQHEFIATVTHELKTPVSVIYSSAQNMADGVILKPDKIKQYGRIMKEQSKRLSDSIDYFLLYSQVNSTIIRKHSLCNLNELIYDVLSDFSEKIKKLDFTIKMTGFQKIITIYCDKTAIKSVIQNLIENVLKHAFDGKYLEITLQPLSVIKKNQKKMAVGTKFNGIALLSFKDHGFGIPHKEQKLIFEAFERGSAASEKQIDGSGIGLNLVKRILAQHGATIHLQSTIHRGSTFTIEFPLFDVETNLIDTNL